MLLHEMQQGVESASHFVCEYDESACSGCGSDCVADCEFIRCCQDHGVQSCGLCPEFPCPQIVKFSGDEWPHHIDVLDNLHRIKEIGIAAWLLEQKAQWSCPSCGKRTHWYQKSCRVCGAQWQARYE